MLSETAPAMERCELSRDAATLWPRPSTADSIPDFDSSTNCLKRSLSSNLALKTMSRMSSVMSPTWLAVHLPRSIMYATGSFEPFMLEVKGDTDIPPVFLPISCVSST